MNLLRDGFAFLDRALKGKGGVVDDPERILQLMCDLGGEPPGRLQLLLPLREFDGFLVHLALFVEEHLNAVTAGGHQQQHDNAEEVWLVRFF